MGKYEPLGQKLCSLKVTRWTAAFEEVERVLGFGLPRSAFEYPAWWANNAEGHSHCRAWLNAGWKTEQVDVTGRKVTFRKIDDEPEPVARPGGRPPIFGAMKGTFRIMPGTDLTAPIDVRWAALEDE